MDFNQLRYFIQIAKTGNISKAAEILNISQPPLSNSLKALENDLNVKLITRNTRNLELTECGEFLLKRGEYILDLVQSTKNELSDISNGLHGTISIGTVSYAGSELLPKVLKEFSVKYPNIKYKLTDTDSSEIVKLVKNHLLDLGIVRTPFNSSDLYFYNLPSTTYVLVGKSLSISSNKKKLKITDLNNMSLLLPNNIYTILNQLILEHNLSCKITCLSNDIRLLLSLAKEDVGYSIIPKDSLSLHTKLELPNVSLDIPELSSGTAIILSKNTFHSKATINFLNYLLKSLELV